VSKLISLLTLKNTSLVAERIIKFMPLIGVLSNFSICKLTPINIENGATHTSRSNAPIDVSTLMIFVHVPVIALLSRKLQKELIPPNKSGNSMSGKKGGVITVSKK